MAVENATSEPTASPEQAARPWISAGRALGYVRRHRMAAIWTGVAALITLSLAALLVFLSQKAERKEAPRSGPDPTMTEALAMLDSGAPLKAQRMAARLAASELPPEEAGGPPFIFGAVAAGDAERLWGEDQKRYYRLAAKYLEESRAKGLPEGREAEGLFLLGKSLLMCGQIADARPVLQEAMQRVSPPGAELLRLLTHAFMSEPEPILDRALAYNNAYLADASLGRNERAEGQLQRAKILFALSLNDQCREALKKVEANTEAGVESHIVEGELLMREAAALAADESVALDQRRAAATAKLHAAIDVLRQAQNRGAERERLTRRSMYLIGRCLLQMDDVRGALDQFRRTRETYEETDEGLAAALEEVELCRRAGQHGELVQKYLALLKMAGDGDSYHSSLVPLEALRSRLSAAYQAFIEAGDFKSAAELAADLYPLFPRETANTLAAQARSTWAETLEAEAAKSTGETMTQAKEMARMQRRQAAAAYAALAQLRFATDRYTDDVWNAAENYLRGHDYARAQAMLQEYLRYELRLRRPRALLDLGDAQLALGRPLAALLTLQECIDNYPRDPATYRARVVASRAQMERGDLQEAKRLLLANLEGTELTPESVEWRDSLFSLGSLLHDEAQMFEAQGRRRRGEALASSSSQDLEKADADLARAKELYEEAARRLEEAVSRYPSVPQVVESRYVIAQSFRALGRFAREKLERAQIETARMEQSRELQRLLIAAVEQYEQVQEMLTRRREQSHLNPLEQSILRNCYFARGAAFYELGRMEEAIEAYSAATNRYHNEPEVLDAFLQLAHCYRQLGKADEARGVVEQAKVVLGRIRDDALFDQTTIHSRQEWGRVLDWLARL